MVPDVAIHHARREIAEHFARLQRQTAREWADPAVGAVPWGMAKRQPTPERTSKIARPSKPAGAKERTNRTVSISNPDEIDEARARAHQRARERTGSDD